MRQTATILRVETGPYGTLGALLLDGRAFGSSLEPPWRMNEVERSSIPAGQYLCTRYNSPSKGLVWLLGDVPGRSWIEMHSGAILAHTAGCILVAQHWQKLRGENIRMLNSGATWIKFLDATAQAAELLLTIREVY